MCIKKWLPVLLFSVVAFSCSKDLEIAPQPTVPVIPVKPIHWVSSVSIESKTGPQTCTDHAAKVVVKGLKDHDWYTTGTPDNFYKTQESCDRFTFKVEQLDSNFAVLNAQIGSVDSQCGLTLDPSVQPQDGKLIRVTAVSRVDSSQSAKLLFGCSTSTGGTGTGTGGTPDTYVISAILLKNQQTGPQLCSTTQGELVVQGTKNGALFSTDFMLGASYEPCSNFEFEVNQVNFANVVTSYNVGNVDFFCHLSLNTSQSDYLQIKVKPRFNASSAPATAVLNCQ